MSGGRAVVALGGNAFASPGVPLTMAGQIDFARRVVGALLDALGPTRPLVITHGNGPQVGHALTRVERALGEAYAIGLDVCVAETAGELGHVLALALHDELSRRGARRPVASLLTHVVVDRDDPAFGHPDKPIGPFYDAARARALATEGFVLREDAGRGYRRVVPSPEPRELLGVELIGPLCDQGAVVIAAGGGGVPVVRVGARLEGVEAVVDKDLASALLADAIGASLLAIVTGVDAAYAGFGTPSARPLRRLDPAAVRAYARDGHFPAGSMGPKMEAAARFASAPGRAAVITDVEHLHDALRGEAGTTVALASLDVREEDRWATSAS